MGNPPPGALLGAGLAFGVELAAGVEVAGPDAHAVVPAQHNSPSPMSTKNVNLAGFRMFHPANRDAPC